MDIFGTCSFCDKIMYNGECIENYENNYYHYVCFNFNRDKIELQIENDRKDKLSCFGFLLVSKYLNNPKIPFVLIIKILQELKPNFQIKYVPKKTPIIEKWD